MGGPVEQDGLSPRDRSYSRILISSKMTLRESVSFRVGSTSTEEFTLPPLDRLISKLWSDSSRLATRIMERSFITVGQELLRLSAT